MAEIFGTNSAEFLNGTSGKDWIYGLWGDDELQGGLGADVLFGSAGQDFALFSDLDDRIWINLNFRAQPGGQDVLVSVEHVIGTTLGDVIVGSSAANVLSGGGGDDVLYGALGDDVVHGGAGNDYLKGGRGADVLDGGEGDDFITSGRRDADHDTIVFSAGGGDDVVEFFNVGSDQLGLENLTESQLQVLEYDTGTLVQADTGDSIFLIGVHGIGLGDLILV